MDLGSILAGSFQRAPWGWALLATVTVALIKVWPVLKKLAIEESSGIRKEFIAEMAALREEVGGLREEAANLRSENAALRLEVRELHHVIDGMRRENQAAQISGQRVIADSLKQLPGGTTE